MKKIWNLYFSFKGEFGRKCFWKGILWMTLFYLPVGLITSLSAYAGVVSLIVIIPAIILVQCMFASLVSGRLKHLGINKKWLIPIVATDLIPFVRLGYLVVFGLIYFPQNTNGPLATGSSGTSTER